MKVLVIYDSDPDGLLSGIIAGQFYEDQGIEVSYERAVRGSGPPLELIDKNTRVIVVDFAYGIFELTALCSVAKDVLILDHHQTAFDELDGFKKDNLEIHINIEKAACRVVWDHFHTEEAPFIVDYVEDMDLWRWALPHSDAINAYLSSIDCNISAWKNVFKENLIDVREKGYALVQYREKTIDILMNSKVIMNIAGKDVSVVNCSDPAMVSYLGNHLAKNAPFGATFYMQADGSWKFSVRSITENNYMGISAREVAEMYGGGGHKNAAGFRVTELFPIKKIGKLIR